MLDAVFGLVPQKARLQKMASQSYLPNLAFVGGNGYGKKTLASYFAKSILCFNKNGCNECEACKLFIANAHPDFILIENDSAKIAISEVLEALGRLNKTPLLSTRKLLLIVDADWLNLESGNALLKMMEDTPKLASICLTLRSSSALLTTLKSRLQFLYLPQPEKEVIGQVLRQKFNWQETEIEKYSSIFSSGLNSSWLADWSKFNAMRTELLKILLQIETISDHSFILALNPIISNNQSNIKNYTLDITWMWLHDISVAAIGETTRIYNSDFKTEIINQVKAEKLKSYLIIFELLKNCSQEILLNANKASALHYFFNKAKDIASRA